MFGRFKSRCILEGTIITLWAFAIPFLVYLHTLAPTVHAMAQADRATVYGLDSAELAAGVYALGIVHAPGYPLYLLLGKAFSYLPFGDVAYRLNLMSAFFAALTVMVLYRLLLRITQRALASFSAALFFAFSYYFWTAAIVAEVYTLHTFLMVSALYILLIWEERRQSRYLYVLALVYGLSFGNHTSTSLMALGLAFFLLSTDYRQALRPRVFLGMALAFMVGLSIYLYLPLRYLANPAFVYAGCFDANGVFHGVDPTTWDGFWWMISGEQFRPLMFSHRWPEIWKEFQNYIYCLWSNFLVLGIIPGIWGGIKLLGVRTRLTICLLLIYLANSIFFLSYRIIDTEAMFIPTYLIWAIFMGVGFQHILAKFTKPRKQSFPPQKERRSKARTVLQVGIDKMRDLLYSVRAEYLNAAKLILLFTPLTVLIVNFQYCDLSDNWGGKKKANLLLAEVEPNAIVLGWSSTTPPLHYLQVTENYRLDVQVINRTFIGWNELRQLIKQKIDIQPIYTIEKDPALADEYELVPLKGGAYKLEEKSGE